MIKRQYNLQFFADGPGGEKTEDATPKKISDARKEGQVARSNEIVAGISLILFFLILKSFIRNISQGFLDGFLTFYKYIGILYQEEASIFLGQKILVEGISLIVKISLPIVGIIFISSILTNLLQVKWEISTKPLAPKLSHLSPITGFKRMFSKDKIVMLIKDVIKVALILYLAYSTLISELASLTLLYDMELYEGIVYLGELAIKLGINIGILYLIIGIGDLFYQKIKFKMDLRMTKQEVKEELKQTEGNPETKSRIRSKMREVSRQRMMESIPMADVIITNPTHFSVAIKYDQSISQAPVLLAKGSDYLAKKIKEIGNENKVPIVENKPLARMLYFNVDIGEEIPPELYEMTAQVLAYVYSLNKEGGYEE